MHSSAFLILGPCSANPPKQHAPPPPAESIHWACGASFPRAPGTPQGEMRKTGEGHRWKADGTRPMLQPSVTPLRLTRAQRSALPWTGKEAGFLASKEAGVGQTLENQTEGLLSSQFLPPAPWATHTGKSGQHPQPCLHSCVSKIKRMISPLLTLYV